MPLWNARVMDAVATFQFPARQATRKGVLMTIASWATYDNGVGRGACPAVDPTVARAACVAWRQAMRHVAALRRSGHIKAVGLNPIEGGRYTVVYDVALDEATRLLWQADAEGSFDTWSEEMLPVVGDRGEIGQIDLPPVADDRRLTTLEPKPVLELRSKTPAAGGGEEGTVGYDFWDEDAAAPQGPKGRQKGQERDGDDIPALGDLGERNADPEAQKGAQRPNGIKAVSDEFRRRVKEINPVLQHNGRVFMTIAGQRRREQGLSVETVAAMADLFFTDPSYMARAKDHPYRYFFQKWAELHERVQRSEPADAAVYSDDARTDEFERRLLGLD